MFDYVKIKILIIKLILISITFQILFQMVNKKKGSSSVELFCFPNSVKN